MSIRFLLVTIGCAAVLGACSPEGPCHYNGDCPDRLSCVSGQCVAVAGACSGSGCVSVSEPCDLYAPHCPSDRRCGLTGFDAEGRPVAACLPARGAELGAACSDANPCQPDLVCVPADPTSSVCRKHCDLANPGGACTAPDRCQPLVRRDASDVPRRYGVCFPDTRYLDPCANDAACDAGQVCSAGPDGSAPLVLKNVCRWPDGTKGAAAPCDADADCRSGYCLDEAPSTYGSASSTAGVCHTACASDADCPAANGRPGGCANIGFPWPDAQGRSSTQSVPSCVVQCTGRSNCRTGETCLPVSNVKGNAYLARCQPVNPSGTRRSGAACATSAECESGLCFNPTGGTDGLCVGVCGSSADCDPSSECAPYGVLQMLAGPDGQSGTSDDVAAKNLVCWGRTCVHDADCAGQSADPAKPRVCAADPDPRNPADTLLACAPRAGSKGGGATCTTDAECASDWCVTWTAGSAAPKKRCFGACQSASECVSTATEKTTCTSQKLNGSATRAISICVPLFP